MARILVIDDQQDLLDVLKEMLEGAGHVVELASNGVEGLRCHESHPADLVVTDLHMPEKDGLQTIKELRAKSPNLKMIAISGKDNFMAHTNLESSEMHGADRTFLKPFDTQEFLAAVEELTNPESE